jgi:hypothetical protein
MPYREYTHCVQPEDYVDPVPDLGTLGQIANFILGGGFEKAHEACNYLLGGKLICLGGDRCAIGKITGFDLPTWGGLDNDFSFNILLSPHELGEFAFQTIRVNYPKVAYDGLQGWLITEQKKPDGSTLMPVPRTPDASNFPSHVYHPDFTTEPSSHYISYDPALSPFQVPGSDEPYEVPVLHVECEGSRVHDVCAALDSVWGPIHSSHVCDIPLIGWFICLIVSIVVLPVVAAQVGIAWASAQDGNADDARVDPGGGALTTGDRVIVTGRWSYDAGHAGSNELHPVKTIQKIGDEAYESTDFAGLYDRWCSRVQEVPPYDGPGVRPDGMTEQQASVYENQLAPEQQWVFHPLIDGCTSQPVII